MKSLIVILVAVLAAHLTVGGDVDLDQLRKYLHQRALKQPRVNAEPIEEQAEPHSRYVYKDDALAPAEQVNDVAPQPYDNTVRHFGGPAGEPRPFHKVQQQGVEQGEAIIQEERDDGVEHQQQQQQQYENYEEEPIEDIGVWQKSQSIHELGGAARNWNTDNDAPVMAKQRAKEDDEAGVPADAEVPGVDDQLEIEAADAEARQQQTFQIAPQMIGEVKEWWANLRTQKVILAERYERTGNPSKDFGIVVTVGDGTRSYLMNNKQVPAFAKEGSRTKVRVYYATGLQPSWKRVESKTITQSTFENYAKACKAGRSPYESMVLMWKLE